MFDTDNLKQTKGLVDTCLAGYKQFKATGATPPEAYAAIRQLYVRTNGWFNDAFQFAYAMKNPAKTIHPTDQTQLPITASECKNAVSALKRDGFYVFTHRVPDKYLDPLMQFSLRAPANLHSKGEYVENSDVCFDPENLVASNYRFSEERVVNELPVQKIMCDPAILHIAQTYIGSQISFTNCEMWWTTPYKCNEAASELAQLFHFDMDRIKFLKFFLYLTDVEATSGPHCYVRGSCIRKPKQFLEDRRFQDAELAAHYKPSDFVEITGRRGTLMAVDTRGFHKGKMPQAGNRLILQLEFGNSLFGAIYPHAVINAKGPELTSALKRDPQLFANFVINEQVKTAELVGAR